MNTILWILQAILCVKLLSVAYTHAFRPDVAAFAKGMERLGGAAQPLLILVAVGAFGAAIALVLRAVVQVPTWLTPAAAALLAVMMLAATAFHLACRETPNVWVSLILFALAAFVACGRWVIAPL
jgi:hypothetical protein